MISLVRDSQGFYSLPTNPLALISILVKDLSSEQTESLGILLGEENAWTMKDQYQAEDFIPTFQKSAFAFTFGLIGGFIMALAVAWSTYGKSGFSKGK